MGDLINHLSTNLEGLQETSGEESSQTNIFPVDFAYALRYAKEKVFKVVAVEVEIAVVAIVMEVAVNTHNSYSSSS